jgi:hypothetical protein
MVAIVTPQIKPLTISDPHAGHSWVFTRFDVTRVALFVVILLGLMLSIGS